MKLIELTKGKAVQVDDEDFDFLNYYNWHTHPHRNTFYARRSEVVNGRKTIISMHRLIMNVTDRNVLIDHKDRNGLNCQKNNLRICTNKENLMNRGSLKNSSSKYKGVDFDKSRNKYRVQITINGKNKFIGRFEYEIEAAKAYDVKAKEVHGEFANLNFN